MPRIERIRLVQFKNHPDTEYVFQTRVVGITGNNGVGKTNLLDAIHTLCFTRSYFSRSDQQLTRHGSLGFRLDGQLGKFDGQHAVQLILRETGKKEIWCDGEQLPRISDHLGRFPVVMIAPDDAELIQGESRARRQFLDGLISQLDPTYMPALARSNRLLQQRQALLRTCAEQGLSAERSGLLDVLDEQWAATIGTLVVARRHWVAQLNVQMLQQYISIAGDDEGVSIEYLADLDDPDPLRFLRSNRARDLAAQRNTRGPHRDELIFRLGEHPFRQVASQGQRKTLLFALKLAERLLLEQGLGLSPILLLDDVFEKLDRARMSALLHWVARETSAQVFITDTDAGRLREHLDPLGVDWQLLSIG